MLAVRVIAACRFVDIDDGPSLRDRLQRAALAGGLKGSVRAPAVDAATLRRCFVFDERQAPDAALAGVAA